MAAPTHADGMLFMEYFKLWDTPLDSEAWTHFRGLRAEGAFDGYDRFKEAAPRDTQEFALFERVCCAYEQAGVLMKNGLMHPDLYFDAWPDPTATWARVEAVVHGMRDEFGSDEIYANFEWLAARGREWRGDRALAASEA